MVTGSTLTLGFPAVKGREVTAVFDGGDVTSDSGVLLLRQADRRLELTRTLADAVCDGREARKVEHPLLEMLRARVYGIALGYEDCNDFDRLAGDPGFKTACDLLPTGVGDLASQPTLSRFENGLTRADLFRMGEALARTAVGRLPGGTERIVIDVDPTDDPCHGQQEFEFFNGYYDCHCYLPLMEGHYNPRYIISNRADEDDSASVGWHAVGNGANPHHPHSSAEGGGDGRRNKAEIMTARRQPRT